MVMMLFAVTNLWRWTLFSATDLRRWKRL